jgi:Trk K+ transport system NAD-binding subunit
MDQPVLLCGLGRVGWRVLEYLQAAGAAVVAIDSHCAASDPRLGKVRLVRGDCRLRETLEEAGVARARGVLILTSNDLVNIAATLMVRHLHPGVRVVLRMFNQNLISRLGSAVTNVVGLSTSALTAPLLALTALSGQALGTFSLEDGRRQVAELTLTEHSPLRDQPLADVAARHEVLVLAHFPAAGGERFLTDVTLDSRLAPGDRLVVCGEPRQLVPVLAQVGEEPVQELLWAGWLRRLGRVVRQTLAEIDWPVKVGTAVLVGVIVTSTLVFHFGVKHRLADALYRTISLMATGADMRGQELEADWQKVFVSVLRLLGAVLTAAFTAIFTNYLLRARLHGALEVRRIPDSGHVVVCGLGNIGFRVVEELLRLGERVVVVERARDSRFLATARQLGVAVILGDATVQEVLRQAHTASARAVLAVTSDELVNLEIALLVRELNPRQRVVVRLADAHLAQTLREAANVRSALSIPALAAPAFVAALFGDRVLSTFLVGGRLLAVLDLVVQAPDPQLEGQTVRAVAVDYRLLPVRLVAADGSPRPRPLGARLAAGDRLTVIAALPDLQRFLRRETVAQDWMVEVTAFPLPAREWLGLLLRTTRLVDAVTAEHSLNHLPFCLGANLSRGQAEELLFLLQRERVTAHVRQT